MAIGYNPATYCQEISPFIGTAAAQAAGNQELMPLFSHLTFVNVF